MNLNTKSLLAMLLLAISFFSCQVNSDHPKILLMQGEEEVILKQMENNPVLNKMHLAILDECEDILKEEPLERIQVGRRLLGVSREYLKRIFYLSYAFRMTGDERFADHAELHMLKAAGFSDWNPSHFLDVGEMTMALAIGYDWLFDLLDEGSKKVILDAMVNKGIRPSYDEKYNWFLEAEHNWNQVCNAGMTYGAIAVMKDYPGLADSVINRAFESIPKAMYDYRPDGAYPEGYGYWGYGTTFNVMFLSAVDALYGDDRGLSEMPGFLKTPAFIENMLAPSGDCYDWGDCGKGGSLKPAMFWFANKNNDPSLLWMESRFLETDDYSKFTGDRLLPAFMIWAKDIPFDEIKAPESKVWTGQGKNPLTLMRTSWTNPDAIFLGFKSGAASVNHAHMDIGSFIMEADGIRWAMELGRQDYHSLESKGIQLFGRTQDAQRWTIFKLNNYVHNTLTFNGELQQVTGYAKIDKYSEDENFMFAVSDISSVYNGQVKKAVRGAAIKDQSYVVIRDEIKTLDHPAAVVWNLTTPADVELTDKGAILTKEGKKLFLKIKSSSRVTMKTWSNQPDTDYDEPNPGTIRVGFESHLPAGSEATFEVILIPEAAADIADFNNKMLSEW